ncbi:hypothetical protein KEM56_004959 [Ascosphaera pollenicola]|nr:hypothetical protein KEM56_004959 [Ascosphaera pollenicola]
MDHYYAECFGYMPPTTGPSNHRYTKPSTESFGHGHAQPAMVPRRPITLQFGTDTQFISAKESPSAADDYSLWLPSETRGDLQTTVSPVAVEEPMLANGFDCDIFSPLSPSTSSSASSYARSLSDCSPPPSGQLYTTDFGYNFTALNAEHTADVDDTLFADLSNIEANALGSMGATEAWATVNCHALNTTSDLEKNQFRGGFDVSLGMYHDNKLSSATPMEHSKTAPSEDDTTPPTILNPLPASSTDDSDVSKAKSHVIRLVGEEHVEGKGLCYIYSDGTTCPKYIKGEPVNAKWGVTKAGRPRKRLAQACMACRHRKIKCTPGAPKCEQCKRSGKTCRFENAPRGNQAKARARSESTTAELPFLKKSTPGKDSVVRARQASAF